MIFIDNRQTKISLGDNVEDTLRKIISYTLMAENVSFECEVSLIFIDNEQIRDLNKEYRDIDKETDVLSFPMLEYPSGKVFKDVYINHRFEDSFYDEGRLVLGDIAISLEKAKAQSEEYGHSLLREVCYLTVHSVLHLLGYDHMEEKEKSIMRSREEEILNKFNINRNI